MRIGAAILMKVGHAKLLILQNSRYRLVLIEALQWRFWSQNHPPPTLNPVLFLTHPSDTRGLVVSC